MRRATGFKALVLLVFTIACFLRPSPSRADGPSFAVGDLYLMLGSYSAYEDAIQRVDPATGSYSTLATFLTGVVRTLTYDAYRNRLIYVYNRAPVGMRAIDAGGTITQLAPGVPSPRLVAARGDGIIYLWYGGAAGFRYLDAADVAHDLLAENGVGPFNFGVSAALDEMIYDPATNSLIGFVGDYSGIAIPQCGNTHASCAVKIPLTPDGTQVAAPVSAAQAEVSASFELPVGAGYAPGGAIFWVVDTNTNDLEPRMQLLDPATMSLGTFASNGPYVGAAATNAGTYSSVRGQGVVLDPFYHDLRAFSYGETGEGTSFADGIDPSMSTVGRLVEIHTAPLQTSVAPPPAENEGMALDIASANPFESHARLRLALPAASRASLTIYDAQGRAVRVLADGPLAAGVHELSWDGRNDEGTTASPGIYFAWLRAEGVTRSVKLTLAR